MYRTIVVACLLLACCSGCGSNSPMAGPQSLAFKGQSIYQGQSNDSIEKALGAPDVVSQGWAIKNWWAGENWITPGELTVEWVYLGETDSLIVWLDMGMVRRVCVVPTEKVKR